MLREQSNLLLIFSDLYIVLSLFRGAAYEEGDIQEVHLTENDCAMKIKNIKESQNGQWQCNVTTKDSHGGYSVDVAKIKLVVAIAPVEVYLKVNGGDPIAGMYLKVTQI